MLSHPATPFSWIAFLTLLGVLGLSSFVFWALVRRSTSHRRWVALSDWARERGFRYRPLADGAGIPKPFSLMPGAKPTARIWLAGNSIELLQLKATEAGPTATAVVASAPATTGETPVRLTHPEAATWNVLIRQVETNWPPTALRPPGEHSLLDLFSLASYPSMIASDRFVIFGVDSAAARALSKSSLPALLPPDIGLLLHGQQMVLDFSGRPFDTLEFDRLIALANSLVSHLPALKK